MPLSIHVKLLRVLETKQFERVGDHQPIFVDVRIITASNKSLERLIAEKRFREDLFFRINVIPIYIPPLRERLEDIPLLINTFITRLRSKTGKEIAGLTAAAIELLMGYDWPGNVRELKSALEYAFVVSEGGLIDTGQLPPQISQDIMHGGDGQQLRSREEQAEKAALIDALRQSRGNQSKAARLLGITRVTVWNRMRKYGLDLKKVMISSG